MKKMVMVISYTCGFIRGCITHLYEIDRLNMLLNRGYISNTIHNYKICLSDYLYDNL